MLHRLLKRQLKKSFADEKDYAHLDDFIKLINQAYYQADIDRGLLERSLDVTSKELREQYAEIQDQYEISKANEEQMQYQAFHDLLTGCGNRTALLDALNEAIENANTYGVSPALLSIDLDGFKYINDSMGHKTGDELLVLLAQHLQTLLPSNALLTRQGGDEFSILLTDSPSKDYLDNLALGILQSLNEPFYVELAEIYVGASIGIAIYDKKYTEDGEQLLQYADMAMYKAKAKGKSRVQFYDPSMSQKASDRLVLRNTLRTALSQEEFYLVYQPKFDLRTNTFNGAEALIRWKRGEEIVSPGLFIPEAESIGLIIPISQWVLRTVCKQLAEWKTAGLALPKVSINVPPSYFEHGNLIADIKECTKEFSISPKLLELEIVENSLLEKSIGSQLKMQALRAMGCTISIDDFGTGYSSFSYLKTLPIDLIKIDRSLIKDISHSETDELFLKSLVTLAKAMKLEIVAEGVEEQDTVDVLIMNDCDYVQGYFYSKPLPAEDYTKLLSEMSVSVVKESSS